MSTEAASEARVLPSTPELDDESPFATMMSLYDEAAAHLGIDPSNYAIMRKPDREMMVSVPVQLDDGTWTVFEVCIIASRVRSGDWSLRSSAGFRRSGGTGGARGPSADWVPLSCVVALAIVPTRWPGSWKQVA